MTSNAPKVNDSIAHKDHRDPNFHATETKMHAELHHTSEEHRKQLATKYHAPAHSDHLPKMAVLDSKGEKTRSLKIPDGFSPQLHKGDGPYQSFDNQHPDWDKPKTVAESQKILDQTGLQSFKEGQKFKINQEDDSVSIREYGAKKDGSYTETRMSNKKVVSTLEGDGKGNFDAKYFDNDGQLTVQAHHTERKDGFSDEYSDADGTLTQRRTVDKVGEHYDMFKNGIQYESDQSNNDGSKHKWTRAWDGAIAAVDQPDQNSRTEITRSQNGKILKTSAWEATSDGSKSTTTDAIGTRIDKFDKRGQFQSFTTEGKDGTRSGSSHNPDGSRTDFFQEDQNHRIELTHTKDGTQLSRTIQQTDENGVRTDTILDNQGLTANVFDASGNQTSGTLYKHDGTQTGWRKNRDGSATTFDKDTTGRSLERTTDKNGILIGTADRNETAGTYTERKFANGNITTKRGWVEGSGRISVHREKTTTQEGKPPDAVWTL